MTALLNNPGVRDAVTARDAERLQGVWNFVTGRRKVQLFINGDHFTAKFNNVDVYVGMFQSDPAKKPKLMDMTVTEGPDRHKGRVARCIYALDGDHLVWCSDEPGADARPRAFPPTDSQEFLCDVFRREKALRAP